MKGSQSSLTKVLQSKGIQPGAFAYFLLAFVKAEEKKGKSLKIRLSGVLVAQAELIQYHLSRRQ